MKDKKLLQWRIKKIKTRTHLLNYRTKEKELLKRARQ
jgi:hypothetical protein